MSGKAFGEFSPRLAMSVCSTFHAEITADIDMYSRAGFQGIGIWEHKLDGHDLEKVLEKFRLANLKATFCFPMAKSLLPGDGFDLRYQYPADRGQRREMRRTAIERLAPFDPAAVVVLAGPNGDREARDARALVVEDLREAAAVARDHGVRLALEVINPRTVANAAPSIPDALDLLDEAGADDAGVLIDFWHLDGEGRTLSDIAAYTDRITGIQVCDRPPMPTSNNDRVLPGEGTLGCARLLSDIRRSGFEGWYEIEIMSDDGTFGNPVPHSLWTLSASEFTVKAHQAFSRSWSESFATAPEGA